MKVQDLVVEVRDKDLIRVGQITERDLVGLEMVLRFNKVGGWKITLPSSNPMATALREPGAGIIVNGPSGVLLSGPTKSARSVKTADDPEGVWEITGADDSICLGYRVAYPTPTTDNVDLQGDYDVRTGAAETVMKAYVNANMGPAAPTARRYGLTTQTDLGRGATVTGRARFETIGALMEQLATTSGLGFKVIQVGTNFEFQVYEPTDRSATIRMDIDNNRLTKSEYAYAAPEATRVIVAGQGAGADRVLLERTTSSSLTAESQWRSRIEVFKDQRSTTELTELQQAGDEILAAKGVTVESVSVTPSDDQAMNFPQDWGLGDRVSVIVGDITVSQIVTEVAVVVTEDGVKIGATVGDSVVAAQADVETQVIETQADQEVRISNLERNDAGSGGGGAAILISETAPVDAPDNAVWFSSKDGTGFVRYADADSSQWVEIKNPNNYTGDTQFNAVSSRLTAVESVTTTQGTQLNNIRSGFYVRQITSQVDTTDRSFGNSWTLMVTYPSLPTFKAGSKILANYQLPLRNDSYSWGGAYIEPQISYNGGSTWYSCGSSGYDGSVMHESAADIATYSSTLFLDPALQGVTTDFTPRFRFYARTYEGSAYWNANHDLGTVSGTATTGAGNNYYQHYAKIVIQELATGQ
jgi:hypothetical protein